MTRRRPGCIDEAMVSLKKNKEVDDYLRYMFREESLEQSDKSRNEIFTKIVSQIENASDMRRKEMGKFLRDDGRPNEVDAEMIGACITEDRWLRRTKALQQTMSAKE